MSSAKYDLLASSKISDFDAVETERSKTAKTRKMNRVRCIVILIVAGLLTIAALTLVIVVAVEATKHHIKNNSTPKPEPPTTQCPSEPPSILVPCSTSSALDETTCTSSSCCWYGHLPQQSRCLLNYQATCTIDVTQMFDCLPENDNWNSSYAEDMCHSRGCCWGTADKVGGAPRCYYPTEYGYSVKSDTLKDIDNGMMVTITRNTPQPPMYTNDVAELAVQVTYETSNMLRIKIFDPKVNRYEVPLDMTSTYKHSSSKPDTMAYSVNITTEQEFGFEIMRTSPTKRTIFKTAPGFVYSDQFLQLSAHIPSEYIYGLGEHATPWKLDTNHSKLTMFSRDIPPDPVNDIYRNLYGVHPFYLCMEEDGSSHGVFLLNSNAMEVELSPYPAITYRTIGGILDFYYFMGPTPEDVVSQYTNLIGRPFMPPYWSLGFHLCRWGYLTANRTMEVVQSMRDHNVPQDTQWNDIDYMNMYLDFTYNHTSFKELPQLVDDLHNHGQKYIVITDPGISATQPKGNYPPFDDGLADGIFITNSTGQPILGTVWPGVTAYPDFTNPKAGKYWLNELTKFHGLVQYDGLWIDMNEPSNFVPGSVSDPPCPTSLLNTPPYLPIWIRQSWSADKLIDKTLCMTAQQNYSLHYNVHSLYGHTEAIATMNSLESIYNKRSVVISRSTFPGSGTRTGHWLGDNASQWPHLRQSIPGILNFALFGIPLVGADICGFFDDTTEQLCTRWQQLGAFYPFSRNHNTYNAKPQHPTYFSEESIKSTRDVLLIRYQLLPFLYTLFYHAHVEGSTVARPLLSVFPTDKETWTNGRQFMWGDALLISPVLEENATSVMAYFPESKWYDYRTGADVSPLGHMMLDAPYDYIPLHIRGGSVVPQQQPATTTTESRGNPFSILVALDDTESASGDLFLDDGDQLNSIETGNYSFLQFHASPGQLQATVVHDQYTPPLPVFISNITIYGMEESPSNITYNANPFEHWEWSQLYNVLSVFVNVSYAETHFLIEWD